ncbi:DNA-binding MarR family transcriptional regulator [Saonia flava]|uniref:DNA-binding MarR family transcriptional regulator n=1 Tax=Saonia flava TaxID=523696 RepID=A0A846QVS0_9FLAO|nr:MarR family transcriptional regulator [Saonia flava]NJB70672.1 DNA-binding MarR family transcriptional regulator [Saonia flava]
MNVEKIIKTDKEMSLESKSIIHLVLVNNKINEALTNALKPFDVSLQQFNVLRILRGQNGKPANLSTLNERMVTKMSNTTRLVDKLLLKEFVERTTCESNRRKVEITLTKKGGTVLEKMDYVIIKTQNSLLNNFKDEELIELNSLLNKF